MNAEQVIKANIESKAKQPKLSVCVVTYNQENYIRQCLQSILEQKTSFYFEVIVGDDCSTDGTRQIVQEFVRRYPGMIKTIFHEENVGACINYIKVHEAACGEYIAHMDGDDYALQGKLQAIADAFDMDSSVNIVFHRMRIRSEAFNIEKDDLLAAGNVKQRRYGRADLLALGAIGCHSAKAYRASTQLAIFPPEGFIDYFVDVEQIGEGAAVLLDDVLGVYRFGIGISSNNKTKRTYANVLIMFLKKYPEYSAEIGANALTCMVADIKNGRRTWRMFCKLFFVARSIRSLSIFVKLLRVRRFFRTNVFGDLG